MKRVQLFEFEDFPWFPSGIRRGMTKLIALLQRMIGTDEVVADLIAPILQQRHLDQIVDLGSGAGGSLPNVLGVLERDHALKKIRLVLTDRYPDPEIVSAYNRKKGRISYHTESVDATVIAKAPRGLKTLMNSFHHMPPSKAEQILRSAQETETPLLIYEMGENKLPLVLWVLLLPVSLLLLIIMVFFMTPFVRPLDWQQLVFTYLIPIIPICYAWDGQASLPRMYTMDDIDLLLDKIGNSPNYSWKKGHAMKRNNKKLGTFVMGLPKGDI